MYDVLSVFAALPGEAAAEAPLGAVNPAYIGDTSLIIVANNLVQNISQNILFQKHTQILDNHYLNNK